MSLGLLDERIGNAIVAAAQEVIDGQLDRHFVLDIFRPAPAPPPTPTQRGHPPTAPASFWAVTSVPAWCIPTTHVIMGQSSNDVIPTSIHLAALLAIKEDLIPGLENLAAELEKKSEEFWPFIKTGRTPLAGRYPRALGPGILGLCRASRYSIQRMERTQEALAEVALGGTAVRHRRQHPPGIFRPHLRLCVEAAGVEIRETGNHFQAQSSLDALVEAAAS